MELRDHWRVLASSRGVWKPLGDLWDLLGSLWEALGASAEPLGASAEPVAASGSLRGASKVSLKVKHLARDV